MFLTFRAFVIFKAPFTNGFVTAVALAQACGTGFGIADCTTGCAARTKIVVTFAAATHAVTADIDITPHTLPHVVAISGIAAVTALRSEPVVQLHVSAAGVVGVQNLSHEYEEITNAAL